jgi:predicted porin
MSSRTDARALPGLLLALAVSASAATAATSEEREYGRFGLAVKSGAAAGPMGIQLAYNFSRHLQICAGGGGTSEFLSLLDRSRTDSYFFMGKYYLDHLYFETGYARKTTKAESIQGEEADRTYMTEQAIPLHIGYEFGHRLGFYFSATAGYFHVIGDGGVLVSPRRNPDPELSVRSAESGFTVGLSVGYYLW